MTETDWSWGDISQEVSPRIETVTLVLDGAITDALEHARADLRAAQRDEDTLDGSATREAREAVENLEERAEAFTRTFTLQSIGYRRWRELVEANPSDKPEERWNPATFVPAVLLECCDQFLSEADVNDALGTPEKKGKLSTGQVGKLFAAARLANEGDDQVPTWRGR